MIWAVHNIHSPAVQIDTDGCHKIGSKDLPLPEPIYTMPVRDDAETLRQVRLAEFKNITARKGSE